MTNLLGARQDYGSKAYVLSAIYAECSELESEWSELWERTNSGEFEGSEIRAMNSDLSKRLNSVTSVCQKTLDFIGEVREYRPAMNPGTPGGRLSERILTGGS